MPTLRIDTNVPKSEVDLPAFIDELSTTISKSLNKPIEYVMVIVHTDVAMTYGVGEGKNPDYFNLALRKSSKGCMLATGTTNF